MRLFCCCTTALALVVLLVACTTVSPDQCWPNTSGGFGGSGSIPIGAGVGVSSGDFGSQPQSSSQDFGGGANPCVTTDDDPTPLDTWLNCRGLDAAQCMEKCAEAGAPCPPRMKHPKKADGGWGDLYRCKNGVPTQTCSYYYSNGDECVLFKPFGMLPWCVYVGGKP